jgi:hypothetical protein
MPCSTNGKNEATIAKEFHVTLFRFEMVLARLTHLTKGDTHSLLNALSEREPSFIEELTLIAVQHSEWLAKTSNVLLNSTKIDDCDSGTPSDTPSEPAWLVDPPHDFATPKGSTQILSNLCCSSLASLLRFLPCFSTPLSSLLLYCRTMEAVISSTLETQDRSTHGHRSLHMPIIAIMKLPFFL